MTTTDDYISTAQVRAARALLGWTQQELANRAKVAPSTIADFERGKRIPVSNNLDAIRAALESNGIAFDQVARWLDPNLQDLSPNCLETESRSVL